MNTNKELTAIIKKYEVYISNLEWHIETNKPSAEKIDGCLTRIKDFKEAISDINTLAQLQQPKTQAFTDESAGVWVKASEVIPQMTHPYGKYWEQPKLDNILISDSEAKMNERDFEKLAEYSLSNPTGAYEGKMWKRIENNVPYLYWFGESKDSSKVSYNHRKIVKIFHDFFPVPVKPLTDEDMGLSASKFAIEEFQRYLERHPFPVNLSHAQKEKLKSVFLEQASLNYLHGFKACQNLLNVGKDEWIDVNDRLPEKRGSFFYTEEVYVSDGIEVWESMYIHSLNKWTNTIYKKEFPIYWMPIPRIPAPPSKTKQ